MKKQHPSQQPAPKRKRTRRSRVQYQPPREETPFSKPRRGRLMDTLYVVITVIGGSALISLCLQSFQNYQRVSQRLAASTTQLEHFKVREVSLNQRLAALQSSQGRHQLLHERGFVKGNERILLFPEKMPQATPQNATRVAESVGDVETVSEDHDSFLGGVVRAIDSAADQPAAR